MSTSCYRLLKNDRFLHSIRMFARTVFIHQSYFSYYAVFLLHHIEFTVYIYINLCYGHFFCQYFLITEWLGETQCRSVWRSYLILNKYRVLIYDSRSTCSNIEKETCAQNVVIICLKLMRTEAPLFLLLLAIARRHLQEPYSSHLIFIN